MSTTGTAAYRGIDGLPTIVAAAVAAAELSGFEQSCRPEHGRLLQILARGVGTGVIGETGTGCGVGLAWLAAGAHRHARLISVERDPVRAAIAAELFADDPRVQVITGDWRDLGTAGPFELLVLDGGGQGKGAEPPAEPSEWLRFGGTVVLDDFTPLTTWPPMHADCPDTARTYWLDHPQLRGAELRVSPDASTIVATFVDARYA